jgi:hypothetical protein
LVAESSRIDELCLRLAASGIHSFVHIHPVSLSFQRVSSSRLTTLLFPTTDMTPTKYLRKSPSAKVLLTFVLCFLPNAFSYDFHPADIRRRSGSPERPAAWGPPSKRASTVPLIVSNNCGDTIWPGVGTQAGTGPGTGGFELTSGSSNSMQVRADWQGRVWGRTNCSFNVAGNGASNLNGNNGAGAACGTGDCGGVLNCVNTVSLLLYTTSDHLLTPGRVLLLSRWQNSILQVGLVALKYSTTSLL